MNIIMIQINLTLARIVQILSQMSKYLIFLVQIKTKYGGGWIKDWTTKYLNGHRGLIGFALEVEDIDATYYKLLSQNINISSPEPLKFRWFFNLLNKTMPWRNSYLPEFEGVPFQFFLQQLNDEKSKNYMEQYMVPNSRDNDIEGISEVIIYGNLTENDKRIIYALFDDYEERYLPCSSCFNAHCRFFRLD